MFSVPTNPSHPSVHLFVCMSFLTSICPCTCLSNFVCHQCPLGMSHNPSCCSPVKATMYINHPIQLLNSMTVRKVLLRLTFYKTGHGIFTLIQVIAYLIVQLFQFLLLQPAMLTLSPLLGACVAKVTATCDSIFLHPLEYTKQRKQFLHHAISQQAKTLNSWLAC